MVSGKFSPGNFSGTKWAREVSGGNLLHPDTFSDFPEPHPAVPSSRKFMPNFREQLTTFGDKKRWDVSSNSERLEAPELPAIQIGPFDSNRSVLVQKITLWEKLPSQLPRHFTRFTRGRM